MEDMGVQGVQVHTINSTHGWIWEYREYREYRYIILTLLMEDMGVQEVQVHNINSTHGGYGSTGTYY